MGGCASLPEHDPATAGGRPHGAAPVFAGGAPPAARGRLASLPAPWRAPSPLTLPELER